MFTKLFSFLTIFIAVLLLAAQCGSAQPEQVSPSSGQQNEAQVDHEAEHDEGGHKDAEAHEEEHEHNEAVKLSAVKLAEGEKLMVLATTTIVGDFVQNIGGDSIDLTVMLPIGSDPHTFAPAPQDVTLVADTHLVFVNGLHLEEFLEELIENSGSEASVVAVSMSVKTRELEEIEGPGHEDKQGNTPGGVDPHIWMTPANAIVMAHNIGHALGKLDPANAEAYEANVKAYETQLEELDAWAKTQIDSIPTKNREMVTDHDSFGYYADYYGLEIIGAVIPAFSTNAEPSAQELAGLQQAVDEHNAKAVFVGTTVNPVLAQRVSEDMGIKLVPLYTGSLGEPGSGVETYIEFIRYNTNAIVNALK